MCNHIKKLNRIKVQDSLSRIRASRQQKLTSLVNELDLDDGLSTSGFKSRALKVSFFLLIFFFVVFLGSFGALLCKVEVFKSGGIFVCYCFKMMIHSRMTTSRMKKWDTS